MNMNNEEETFGSAVVGVAMNKTEANVGVLRDNPTKVKIHLEKNERSQTYGGGSLLCVVAHSVGVDDKDGTAKEFVTVKGSKAPTGVQTAQHFALCHGIAKKAIAETGTTTRKALVAWIDAQVEALTATDDTDDTDGLGITDDDTNGLGITDDEAPAPSKTAEVITPTGDGVTVAQLVKVIGDHREDPEALLGEATDILVASGHRVALSSGRIVDMKTVHPDWSTDWKTYGDVSFDYRFNNGTAIWALFSKKDQIRTAKQGARSWVYTADGRKKPLPRKGSGEKPSAFMPMDNQPVVEDISTISSMALVHAALVVTVGGDCWNVDPRVYLHPDAVGELATMQGASAWFKDDLSFKGQSWDLPFKTGKASSAPASSGDPLADALGNFTF